MIVKLYKHSKNLKFRKSKSNKNQYIHNKMKLDAIIKGHKLKLSRQKFYNNNKQQTLKSANQASLEYKLVNKNYLKKQSSIKPRNLKKKS